ncbi:unnamed protein product [Schistosoma mattheei]|uniref:Uncharacterized protein n=1 Tax=Schistosoma mattheei TaxID=31246 RepID=A0A183PCT1_9TREM|nr:unnamed protein product [Schistosoma mattheei]
MDSVPALSGRRELFVLAVVVYCFIGALASTTCGGYLVLTMLDRHGAPISILFIVFCECVALCWFYERGFCEYYSHLIVESMSSLKLDDYGKPGIFIANIVSYETQPVSVLGVVYEPTTWVIALSWAIVFSSPIFIPILMIYQLLKAKGTFLERLRFLTTPEDRPAYGDQQITLNAIGEYVPKKTSKTNKLYGNPQ